MQNGPFIPWGERTGWGGSISAAETLSHTQATGHQITPQSGIPPPSHFWARTEGSFSHWIKRKRKQSIYIFQLPADGPYESVWGHMSNASKCVKNKGSMINLIKKLWVLGKTASLNKTTFLLLSGATYQRWSELVAILKACTSFVMKLHCSIAFYFFIFSMHVFFFLQGKVLIHARHILQMTFL